MHWPQAVTAALAALSAVQGVCANEQVPFAPQHDIRQQDDRPWHERPSKDATGNLIFQSLASLLQLGPNSKYSNGHSIVRASIPAGTLLYHGRTTKEPPTRDWIALDPEHSQFFAAGLNGTLFTFVTTRELRLLHFDGCSANKFDGAVDTQDVLFWGAVGYDPHDEWCAELARFHRMCEWGRQYALDGVVRMQYDFEIMYCDVWNGGLELVSAASLVANDGMVAANPDWHNLTSEPHDPKCLSGGLIPRPRGPLPAERRPMVPPDGWRGSLPSTYAEVIHTGAWHNRGEGRVRVDPATLVSFFDPALTSLVAARRGAARAEYRLAGISQEDIARVQADVAEMMARDPAARSGVDWHGLARTIQDRFADRLPYMRHLLHEPARNASAQAVAVRRALLVSLLPYMGRARVGAPEWYAEMADACATRHVAHLPVARFTRQERVLYGAAREVLREVCRVYTEAWRDAFDVEAQSAHASARLLAKWRGEFDALVEWLDWPVWMGCDPPCGVDEFCRWPQGAPWESDPNPEPHCVSLIIERM